MASQERRTPLVHADGFGFPVFRFGRIEPVAEIESDGQTGIPEFVDEAGVNATGARTTRKHPQPCHVALQSGCS